MSSGEICKSCKDGTLHLFKLSDTEAILKCNNLDCESFLDFLPQQTVVTTGTASTYRSSSNAVSCPGSPGSADLSQYSSTDLEVAHLNKPQLQSSHSLEHRSYASQIFAPSQFPSSCSAPTSAVPSVARSASFITNVESGLIDLENAPLEDVDLFLDSLVNDPSSCTPSMPSNCVARALPSHGSAFSHVPSVTKKKLSSNESVTDNYPTSSTQKNVDNKAESVWDTSSEVGNLSSRTSNIDMAMLLDENQFRSPSGSIVSEDSGYNDEIPTTIAVWGSGTRGRQAETKTTNSNMPAPLMPQLGQETVASSSFAVASHGSSKDVTEPKQATFLSTAESQSSPVITPFTACSTEAKIDLSPASSNKSYDSSTNPDSIPLPAALSSIHESDLDLNPLSNLHCNTKCLKSSEQQNNNEETNSKPILSCAQLSLTSFLPIFEQNLSTVVSKRTNDRKSGHSKPSIPIPIGIDERLECPKETLVSEESCQISGQNFNEQSQSGCESPSLTPEQHASNSVRPILSTSINRGRPPKRKYKKRTPKNSETMQDENVDMVSSAQKQDDSSPHTLVNNLLPPVNDDSSNSTPTVIPDVPPPASLQTPAAEVLPETRVSPVPNSDGAPEVKGKRKYTVKRKNTEESPAPRKSARHQANPVESSRDTSIVRSSHSSERQAVSSSSYVVIPESTLANIRPSLAALLPPLPHYGSKHRCESSRSNKRQKPSQPFRHLANAVGPG